MTSQVPEAKKSKKVAVVGAGPAGLAAAYYLALQGYPVTIYEALPLGGGMVAVGIPPYRQPRRDRHPRLDLPVLARRVVVHLRHWWHSCRQT